MAASEAGDVLLLLLLAWDCTSYDCFVNVHTIVGRVHRYPRQATAGPICRFVAVDDVIACRTFVLYGRASVLHVENGRRLINRPLSMYI